MTLFSFNLNSVNQRESEQGSQLFLVNKTREAKSSFFIILEKAWPSQKVLFFFSLISALFLAFLAGWAHEDETVSFALLFDSFIEMFAEGL